MPPASFPHTSPLWCCLYALCITLLASCALVPGYTAAGPPPLPHNSPLFGQRIAAQDGWLRHHLLRGDSASALGAMERGSPLRPDDSLIRNLQHGTVLRLAGRYRESNRAFAAAERETERRRTRSLRRAAGSLLVNDGVLQYIPGPTERLMVPYQRMMNYLSLDDRDGAVVEARKAARLLMELEDDTGSPCELRMVQHLTGLVFEQGGQLNDALVALRRTDRTRQACRSNDDDAGLGRDLVRVARAAGAGDIAHEVADRYEIEWTDGVDEAGEIIVLVERGFVAHRVPVSLDIPLYREELHGLHAGDAGAADVETVATAAVTRIGDGTVPLNGVAAHRFRPGSTEIPYLLRVAWAEYTRAPPARTPVQLTAGTHTDAATGTADLSAAVAGDFERTRLAMMGRAVARALLKERAAREAERRAERAGGELAGTLAGMVVNAVGYSLEQADLRSWSTLPADVSIARLRLPPGEHSVRISGEGWDEALEPVQVRSGERVLLGRRVFEGRAGVGAGAGSAVR